VGDTKLTHIVGLGGIWDTTVVTPTEITTLSPWAYSCMAVGTKANFDGCWSRTTAGETYSALIDAQTSMGQLNGLRFVSGSHPYSLGVMQTTPLEANFNWRAASDCFILPDADKWKYYVQASSESDPVVLAPGQSWRVTNFRYAAPL